MDHWLDCYGKTQGYGGNDGVITIARQAMADELGVRSTLVLI